MKPDTDTASVAQRLKSARQRVFRSAAQAAEGLGMNASTVRAHENGQNGVNIFDLERYARRYGVSIDWLAAGKGEMDVTDSAPSQADHHYYPVMGILQDGAWLEDDPDSDHWPGWGWLRSASGVPEDVAYTDPRFPDELLTAMKVRTTMTEGAYTDGTIVFAADVIFTGYREGDHVVVMREKGEYFYEWSLRRVTKRDGETWLEPLISDGPAYKHIPDRYIHEHFSLILGVVVGSLSRRPVPPLSIEARKNFEEQEGWRRKGPSAIPMARRVIDKA
jgi:transcriptional regulator with XRE-family HTH domain